MDNRCITALSTIKPYKLDELNENSNKSVVKINDIVSTSGELVRGTIQINNDVSSSKLVHGLVNTGSKDFYYCVYSEQMDNQVIGHFLEKFISVN